MKKYTVVITGTWSVDIEANTDEEAEELAYRECLKDGTDVEGMNLEFEAYEDDFDIDGRC
jgi:hypothetical protein